MLPLPVRYTLISTPSSNLAHFSNVLLMFCVAKFALFIISNLFFMLCMYISSILLTRSTIFSVSSLFFLFHSSSLLFSYLFQSFIFSFKSSLFSSYFLNFVLFAYTIFLCSGEHSTFLLLLNISGITPMS